MSLFLITFLSLYGGMHAYAFLRLRGAFLPNHPLTLALAAWMILMTAAPMLVRLAEGAGLERSALFLAWPGYTWMGAIFIFVATLLACDALRLLAWLSNRLWGTATPGFLTATVTCTTALIFAFLASTYAFYDARRIRTDHVTVTTAKLPPSVGRVRIVQISDVHIGLLFRESRLNGILTAVRNARPDILVSTGDLVDGRLSREDVMSHQNRLATMLASIETPGGKYAVTGNHEFYAGLNQALAFTRTAGFTVLRNQAVPLPNGITISGVDDPAGRRMGVPAPPLSEQALLRSVPRDRFCLLLKHRPDIPAASDGLFDLQLSGHVHKGQIFPFNLLVRLQYPIPCGTTATAKNSLIHVSRGSGTWGPPLRLLAPPEVTIIDIIPQGEQKP
ncbi:metallophosphoesterase [Oryzomonas japonica]|uniref:Metallophosphoesterase n=1 Tax=Oryzomonas japonica TaxID=2603858 RepID=A0A7J4ZSN5_9BACT|nr:metallophosphoesterase [Oryzomonas japonica]KAB0666232.1 metallophosphoesterase [Oryzomonas japonica]